MKTYGYNNDDPLKDNTMGYRSQTGGFDVGELSYNGFIFPPTKSASLTVIKEYDETQRVIKYLTLSVTVDCIVTKKDYDISGLNRADSMADELRERLSQSGKALRIDSLGVGSFFINDPNTSLIHSIWPDSVGIMDVDNGPRPQVLEVKPGPAGKSCQISFLITARIPACNNATVNSTGQGTVSINWSVDWENSDEGVESRKVSADIEVASTRRLSKNDQIVDIGLSRFRPGLDYIYKIFPRLGETKRKVSYNLSKDKKILRIQFTDALRKSDNLFPRGVLDMSFDQKLSSTFEEGFYRWKLNYSGKISVPVSRRFSTNDMKAYALSNLDSFILNRLRAAKGTKFTKPSTEEGSSEEETVKTIPVSISISDSYYDNSFSFSFSYILIAPTILLFKATNFFDRNKTSLQNPQLNSWKEYEGYITNLRSESNTVLSMGPESEALVDLCHPLVPSESARDNPLNPQRQDQNPTMYLPCPENEDESWVDFNNHCTLIKEESTISLQATDTGPGVDSGTSSPYPYLDPDRDEPDKGGGERNPIIYKPTGPTYRVKMEGSVVRIGWKIEETPNLVTFRGATAELEDENVFFKTIAEGKSFGGFKSTEACPIYKASWVKYYVLTSAPLDTENEKDNGITDWKQVKARQ